MDSHGDPAVLGELAEFSPGIRHGPIKAGARDQGVRACEASRVMDHKNGWFTREHPSSQICDFGGSPISGNPHVDIMCVFTSCEAVYQI